MNIVEAQPQLTAHFGDLVRQNRLAHAYLLAGPAGSGKKELALWIAKLLFCEHLSADGPCDHCSECTRISEHEHPDVVEVSPTGLSIKIDQIRYLKSEFAKSGVEGAQKVFIIEDAEKMSTSAANGLLKFLEEPSGTVTAFLLTSEQNKILPTIISRCQLLELNAPALSYLVEKLKAKGISQDQAILLSNLTKDADQAEKIGTDEDFQKLLTKLWDWYSAVLRNDLISFVKVQIDLVPLVDSREKQDELLFLIALLARDLMLFANDPSQKFVFTMFEKDFSSKMANISAVAATDACEAVLKKWRLLSSNVSIQNILESLTLELCDCYHR
ncbi:DNA polymerase III subunit delta' [Ligilactobacillus acidipiscis]|uniref:DNA polymerase III subunit delta' n=1 Tax=Ligilactobacillus acidipiscis TaxID=89059 RepID=UPI000A2430BA|nr:DNA polymerase III subunit delta' [Ligilactobacillus acidipiscis]GEN21077.1 DNA polymerase III subunit delta' [Ligilactobacillus acidipiscis]